MTPIKKDRSHWVGGIASSHEEMEAIDQAWWLALSVAERFALVTELSSQQDWSRDVDPGETSVQEASTHALLGLRGAPWGVRKRAGL